MKYIPKKRVFGYDTNFADDILSSGWNDSELDNDDLKNYKAKAEYYIREHQDHIVIAKLKTNQPLTQLDVESLRRFSGVKWEPKRIMRRNLARNHWVSLFAELLDLI